VEVVEPKAIDALLPRGAVHQGVAVRAAPLEPVALATLLQPASGLIVLLDQVTDPQNVGAMLRSAVAFGARGVILQDRKAPPFSGGCAKAAVGAAERIAHARVVNLSRALDQAREAGWTSIGLAGEATGDLDAALPAEAKAELLATIIEESERLNRFIANLLDMTRLEQLGFGDFDLQRVGVGLDANFLPGADDVLYEVDVGAGAGPFRVSVRAYFQSVKPAHLEGMSVDGSAEEMDFLQRFSRHSRPSMISESVQWVRR